MPPESGTPGLPACPVCGAREWRSPREGASLRPCGGCGSFFNDRSAGRGEEEARYRDCPWVAEDEAAAVVEEQWRWVERHCCGGTPAGARVLDVGSGTGAFLERARQAGADTAGVELDPANVARCRERGLTVREGSLFDVGLPDGPWDVVTLWDVLDHLEEPVEALRIAAAVASPGGWLVVRGRNADLHARLLRLRGRPGLLGRLGDAAVVHRWGWSPRAWKRLLSRAGLRDVRVHPAPPTPGDRYGTLGGSAARGAKALVAAVGRGLHSVTGGRLYAYPSVLLSGRASGQDSPAVPGN